ncbi:unnamed protein product [Mytilus edulis]|uniref:Uncharacterized protein n=1 Tax=Mytilus edulis TaxID=6550 RepID=A0A8S3VFI2_MYTED|nr:unnamed protein product [Mytilus edulis]
MHDNRKQRVASKNLQAKKRVKQLQVDKRKRKGSGRVDSYEMAVMKSKLALDTSNVESEDQGETQRDSIVNVQRIVFDQPTRRVLWSRGSPKTIETPVVEEPATIAWESKARKRLFSPGPSFGTMESFLDLAVSIERLYPEKERIEAENRKLKQKVTKLKQKLNNRIWRLPILVVYDQELLKSSVVKLYSFD